ncbi:MAG: hypothetical protein OQL19_12570 [Gammaproteobacteria bacterium]|nr:hypothetical protein [Gammaproteobacteria bacterium]
MQSIFIKNIIVLLGIGLFLALITFNGLNFYNLLNRTSEPLQPDTTTTLIKQSKKIPPPQAIVRWHLFGTNSVKQQAKVPKSTLRLKIIGIISSTLDGEARVIIEDSSRKQKFYKVGDKIKQNVSVKSIHADHIVIMHNSRQEIVQFKSLNIQKNIIKKVVLQ